MALKVEVNCIAAAVSHALPGKALSTEGVGIESNGSFNQAALPLRFSVAFRGPP